jgi:hypothetical protein
MSWALRPLMFAIAFRRRHRRQARHHRRPRWSPSRRRRERLLETLGHPRRRRHRAWPPMPKSDQHAVRCRRRTEGVAVPRRLTAIARPDHRDPAVSHDAAARVWVARPRHINGSDRPATWMYRLASPPSHQRLPTNVHPAGAVTTGPIIHHRHQHITERHPHGRGNTNTKPPIHPDARRNTIRPG